MEEYLHSPKAKEVWKSIVKKHQNKFWKESCKEDQENKKTLKYLQLQENLTKPHNIWHSVKNSEIDVKAGEIKAKIATQTYMVQCQKSKFVKNAAATCPLCGIEDEDLCHFILDCTKLSRIRKRHLQKIEDYLEKIHKGLYIRIVNENKLLQVIIDCTSSSINYMRRIRSKNYTELEILTRNFCLDLHRSRTRQMAG